MTCCSESYTSEVNMICVKFYPVNERLHTCTVAKLRSISLDLSNNVGFHPSVCGVLLYCYTAVHVREKNVISQQTRTCFSKREYKSHLFSSFWVSFLTLGAGIVEGTLRRYEKCACLPLGQN